jgi:predicted N-formylglutamate amidohydrolase
MKRNSKTGRQHPPLVIVTCEHASNHVPARFRGHFSSREAQRALRGHQGWDLGALRFARQLAAAYDTRCHEAAVTRLLVDLNRSAHHSDVYSRFSRKLIPTDKAWLMSHYYLPFRAAVQSAIEHAVAQCRQVVHLSVHSFTPILRGERRRAALGLLYDPSRSREVALCREWQRAVRKALPDAVIRRNYPYRGAADGHTSALRKRWTDEDYLGIEIEMNQGWLLQAPAETQRTLLRVFSQLETRI